MVLVDTSVWIRFLAGREPWGHALDRLLEHGEVVGHQLIFGELLIGDLGGRGELLSAYALMHQGRLLEHEEVVTFVRDRRLHGRGVGWIDIHLLASAIVDGHEVWTLDPRFAAMATSLGVSFSPGAR